MKLKKLVLALTLTFVLSNITIYAGSIDTSSINKSDRGIKKVLYKIGDSEIIANVPPKDFDPIKATDEELSYYGIPARPTDTEQYNKWVNVVGNKKCVEPSLKIKPGISYSINNTTVNSAIWCGAVRKPQSPCTNFIDSTWTVPNVSVDNTSHLPAHSAQWVGLGTNNIAQTGTTELRQVGESSFTYFPWFMLYGIDSNLYSFNNLVVRPLDSVYASVTLASTGNPGQYNVTFFISNNTIGTYAAYTYINVSSPYLTQAANWIHEVPLNSFQPRPSASINFSYCTYKNSWGGQYITLNSSSDQTLNGTLERDYLYNIRNGSTSLLAIPGTVSTTGQFSLSWITY